MLISQAHKKSATAVSSDVSKVSDQKHSDSKTRIVSWTELESHTESDSLWIAVEGEAYDVTEWSLSHPGGVRLLHLYAGKDATDPFLAYHPSRIKSLLPKFLGKRGYFDLHVFSFYCCLSGQGTLSQVIIAGLNQTGHLV